MSRFYLPSGYFDFDAAMQLWRPFTIIIGGRGAGKTYGALEWCINHKVKFAFMRRTQRQLDIINKPEFSPLKPLTRNTGQLYTTKPLASGLAAFYEAELNEDGETVITRPEPIGITLALSTVSNLRGFDASDIDVLLYDEFIPEKSDRPLKHEEDAIFNCYETLNRNRELDGRPPLRLVMMANANDQASPVLVKLGLVQRLDRMAAKGVELWQDPQRGLAVILLAESPISDAKGDTALYRLTAGTEFADMALENAFAYEDRGNIGSRPLEEYRPVCGIGGITVYKHKSSREIYVSPHRRGAPPVYATGETELARWREAYGWLWRDLMDDRIVFEDFATQVVFRQYLGA